MVAHGRILVDCGFTVYPKLMAEGIASSVNTVLLTHLHNDHVGSLSTFIYYKVLVERVENFTIIYPSGPFLDDLRGFLQYSIPQIDKLVTFIPVEQYPGIIPLDTTGKHAAKLKTFGYIFEEEGQRIIFSGDLGDAHYIEHAVSLNPQDVLFHDTGFYAEVKAHAYYQALEHYLAKCRIIGYHHDPQQMPYDCLIPSVAQVPDYLWLSK